MASSYNSDFDPALPGGTLFSRVRVYDGQAPDGQSGGTPHIHLACAEMYYVLQGRGAVEFLNRDGAQRFDVAANDAISFTPGTIHRLINPGGDMEVLVIMQNKGLPERGDVALPFPCDVLRDAGAHDAAMKVASAADAKRRRDLAVQGFAALKQIFADDQAKGREQLTEFYRLAIERTRHKFGQWREIIETGPKQLVDASLEQLAQLERGDVSPLEAGRVFPVTAPGDTVFGFCGNVNPYHPAPEQYSPEGIQL